MTGATESGADSADAAIAVVADGRCGRADLVRALAAGKDRFRDLAERLGYVESPPDRPVTDAKTARAAAIGRSTAQSATPSVDPARPLAPLPQWQPVQSQRSGPLDQAPPHGSTELPSWSGRTERGAAVPGGAPLCPWPDLVPRLRGALLPDQPSRQVDLRRLVAELSRARLPTRLPRRRRRRWGDRLLIIADHSERLTPYWGDQAWLAQRLRELMPSYQVSDHVYLEGRGSADYPWYPLPGPPPAGALVLLLGDLGGLARSAGVRAHWATLGERMRAAGCRCLALNPVGPCEVEAPGGPAGPWTCVPWVAEGPRDADRRALDLERLLTLATLARQVEPGLLRRLRRLVGADAATEGEFWQHRAVTGRSALAAVLAPAEVERRRAALARLDRTLKGEALEAVRDWRVTGPDVVWHGEACRLLLAGEGALLTEAERVEAYALIDALGLQARGQGEGLLPGALGWFQQLASRLPPDYLDDPELSPHFYALWDQLLRRNPGTRPPDALDPQRLPLDPKAPLRRVRLWQAGDRLVASYRTERPHPGASLLAELAASKAVLRVEQPGRPARTLAVREDGDRLPLPAPTGFQVISDRERLRFARLTLDDCGWASALGRDRYGLWAEIAVEPDRGPPVVQRLRWVPPGQFWMGSPQGEPGRYEDEGPRVEVRLADGFWLFDTPVTQALWQAVMGDNPSAFRSPDRPVESVGWDDGRKFIETINQRIRGLDLSLPSEARWEYACRAGSDGALYTGPIEILGDADAPALDPIAWYGGNSQRGFELDNGHNLAKLYSDEEFPSEPAGTHPVARKQPNAWGLYDMLGNVWEWTADVWQDSHQGAATDGSPRPGRPGARRVVRGGSWGDSARFVRCAFRARLGPGLRSDYLGLRCARVQRS